MRQMKGLALCAVAVLLCRQVYALGSGAIGNESGVAAKATSHGFAFAGVADDPSAIFYNPAGLVQVKGFQVMAGVSVVDLHSEHTAPNGDKDTIAQNLPVVPNFYASWSDHDSRWATGIGINSPFGLVTEWKDDSFAKYYATESKILLYMVNPTLAYKVSDQFSIGVGANYVDVFDAELHQKVPDNVIGVPGPNDGDARIHATGQGWGYNLGLHWKPSTRHSFGLSYRSQINVPVAGNAELRNLTSVTAFVFGGTEYTTGASTEFKLPQSVLFGYGFKPNAKWTVFADYQWVNWNVVENTDFNYAQDNVALTHRIKRNWKNTSNIGIGAERTLSPQWKLRFGGLAYERVIPSSTLSSDIPDAGRVAVMLGGGYQREDTSIDFGYTSIFFDDRTVNNNAGNAFSSMDGKFETHVNVFNVGITQKWGRKG